jgi:predicted acetyltransferase
VQLCSIFTWVITLGSFARAPKKKIVCGLIRFHKFNIQNQDRMDELGKTDLRIQHLKTEDDVPQYLELVRKIWGEDAGVDTLAKKLIDCHPKMTLNDFYVIKEKGRMISTLNLIPVTWSIGGIDLKVAEMGHVGTLPEYRGRGLIQKLVYEYHKDVQKQEYDISVIEGIPYFYRQFGYEYAIPLLEETKIRIDQIPEFKTKIRVRAFTKKDVPKAKELLDKSQTKYYVHSIRDEAVWKMQQRTSIASDPEPFQSYAVEEQGQLVAYFRMREVRKEKELLLTEITEVDHITAQAVLGFLKKYGKEHGLENLSANISYEESFSHYMVSLGAVKSIPTYAWQIRITDYAKIFQKLKPLLEHRLADSMYSKLTETLNFNFRTFTIQAAIEDGKIRKIKKIDKGNWSPIGLNPLAFIQLMTGYKKRQQLEEAVPDIRMALSHKHLIDVLFPKMPSYIHSGY